MREAWNKAGMMQRWSETNLYKKMEAAKKVRNPPFDRLSRREIGYSSKKPGADLSRPAVAYIVVPPCPASWNRILGVATFHKYAQLPVDYRLL